MSQIQPMRMSQLDEAVDPRDDWIGLTDAAARRKRQNRLNVRAYRRRKAPAAKGQQTITVFPESASQTPLIPATPPFQHSTRPDTPRIIFPLSADHLIKLLQFNVLRGLLTIRHLLSVLQPTISTIPSQPNQHCTSAALQVLPSPPDTTTLPPSLQPMALQRTVPHEEWVDLTPHPVWRGNVLRALGRFDEDALWADTIGGLFGGFPDAEIERRGVVCWASPWGFGGVGDLGGVLA